MWKKVFLKISQISQENICVGISFDKVAGLQEKETSTKVFFCEFCKIFKNIYFWNMAILKFDKNPNEKQFISNKQLASK